VIPPPTPSPDAPPAGTAFRIGLATFGILALELALIRWTSGQVRIFAYFNNLVLISAFLGMGLGLAVGRRRSGLVHWTLPALLPIAVVLAFAKPLGLIHVSFPDVFIHMWGADRPAGGFELVWKLGAFFALVLGIMIVFLFAGAIVGELFTRMSALHAYSADLTGSLLGILAFTAATFLNAGPPVWLFLGAAPFAWLSRRAGSWACLALVVGLGAYSVDGAVFSPYNRIDITPNGHDIVLSVNRDFHQTIHDVSDAMLQSGQLAPLALKEAQIRRKVYDLPFRINEVRGSALVVGAGTGNDVAAALRNGYGRVHSVDIDGQIIALGRKLHPERPYADPRVVPIVNDARAFFEQYDGPPFDVVCYGLLDSHAMFSALSSLRLDNYIYTEEGLRAAWKHVSPRGHMSVSFSVYAGPWIADRLYWTITKATGQAPVMIYHGMNYGCTFLVARNPAVLDAPELNAFPHLAPTLGEKRVRSTSDDWPFLYVRPGVFPWGYLVVLTAILILALVTTPLAFGRDTIGTQFDPVLFFMGAGFLLLETRGVTTLSLLFGSTWLVNSAVFSGIVVMALLANLYVQRRGLPPVEISFVLLLLSIAVLYSVDTAALNRLDLLPRGILGGLVNALPIGFAGLIVSTRLARSAHPAASLGSNLLGSVLGGCLEYLSMDLGLRALVLLALALYLGAFFYALRTRPADAENAPMPLRPAARA
jgi:hypothetical protein